MSNPAEPDWCEAALRRVAEHRRAVMGRARHLHAPAAYQSDTAGKMLRPTVLLCFAAVGDPRPESSPAVLRCAAAVEVIHEASLVHDDILDQSAIRRGRASVAERFGVSAASHLGGFMVLTAVAELAEVCGHLDLGLLRSLCVAQLEEGLAPPPDPAARRLRGVRVILGKTGALFRLAAQIGAGFASVPLREEATRAAGPFAERLALAFQLRDDLADFLNDAALRKPGGSDLFRGLPTLPFQLWAGSQPNPEEAWDRLLAVRHDAEAADALRTEVIAGGIADEVRAVIREQLVLAREALAPFAPCPAVGTLHGLLSQLAPAS